MLRLNNEIPNNEARKLLDRACFVAAATDKVTPDTLLAHAEVLEKKYLSTPKSRFRLVTSISADFLSKPVVVRHGTTEVCYGRVPIRSAASAHSKKVKEAEHSIHGSLPSFYSPVSVLVTARNPDEAATQAINQVDLYRGIWNFWKNRTQGIRISSGKPSPVNSLILGPIHTLHSPNGELATDAWWYEPTYLGPVNIWREPRHRLELAKFTKNIRTSLRKLPYRSVIETALIRYTRALDSRDWNSSFLELWSILELLTNTTMTDSHKVTVRRSAFLFQNAEYAVQVLNHLRSYRNTAVHGGKEGQNAEPVMYQAKNFVEALLEFHLSRAGEFKSLTDIAAFLDLPAGITEIDRQLIRLKAARKYIVG